MQKIQRVQKNTVKYVAFTGMLTALAFVLMLFDFPIAFLFPAYLQIDFSDIPALIAAFWLSPILGVAVELAKNVLHLIITTTGGIGELANFLVGATFVFTAGIIHQFMCAKKHKAKKFKFVIISLISATIAMAVIGGFVNYFVTIPFYSTIMPFETILNMSSTFLPFIKDKFDIVIFTIVPFNLLKGVVISVVILGFYNTLSKFIASLFRNGTNK